MCIFSEATAASNRLDLVGGVVSTQAYACVHLVNDLTPGAAECVVASTLFRIFRAVWRIEYLREYAWTQLPRKTAPALFLYRFTAGPPLTAYPGYAPHVVFCTRAVSLGSSSNLDRFNKCIA